MALSFMECMQSALSHTLMYIKDSVTIRHLVVNIRQYILLVTHTVYVFVCFSHNISKQCS